MARITGSDAKKLYELYDSIYEMKECEHQEENFEHVLEEEDLQEYDVDLFDLIKGHLIDEGYAETEEAALAMMANMTEEWRNNIIESITAE